MRSICVIASYGPSLVNFRGPLIAALRDAGVRVTAIASDLDEATRDELGRRGVVCMEVVLRRNRISLLGDIAYLLRLTRLLRQIRPEAVLPYTAKPVIFGSLAARFAGVKRRFALISGRGSALSEGQASGWQRWIVKALYRLALRGSETVIFQNADDLQYFRRHGLIHPAVATAVVAGSGVDLSRFGKQPMPARPTFLMIARFLHAKGVREYVMAAGIVKKEFPEARFWLAGWFENSAAGVTPEELQSWNAESQVEILGHVDDVRAILRDTCVFVLPSYYGEGIPRTNLEAMAVGRAIITTDTPGCRETVRPGLNGWLVAPRDPGELAEAMFRMLRDPQLVVSMGAASREYAERRFDAGAVAAETAHLLMGEQPGWL